MKYRWALANGSRSLTGERRALGQLPSSYDHRYLEHYLHHRLRLRRDLRGGKLGGITMKTMNEQWEGFKKSCIPDSMPPEALLSLRAAFYAGAMCTIQSMELIGADPNATEGDACAVRDEIMNTCFAIGQQGMNLPIIKEGANPSHN
jgi:hypothetical protein